MHMFWQGINFLAQQEYFLTRLLFVAVPVFTDMLINQSFVGSLCGVSLASAIALAVTTNIVYISNHI